MNKNKEEIYFKYISNGIIIGLISGLIFSIINKENDFLAIMGTSFGFILGLLISITIWYIKEF